jgi:hypothetical protein
MLPPVASPITAPIPTRVIWSAPPRTGEERFPTGRAYLSRGLSSVMCDRQDRGPTILSFKPPGWLKHTIHFGVADSPVAGP